VRYLILLPSIPKLPREGALLSSCQCKSEVNWLTPVDVWNCCLKGLTVQVWLICWCRHWSRRSVKRSRRWKMCRQPRPSTRLARLTGLCLRVLLCVYLQCRFGVMVTALGLSTKLLYIGLHYNCDVFDRHTTSVSLPDIQANSVSYPHTHTLTVSCSSKSRLVLPSCFYISIAG